MKAKIISAIDPRIRKFCELVNRGVESWTEAGRILCEIKDENADAYGSILAAKPWLTRDMLETFERIGRKQIYPYLLVDGSPGAVRLASFPYSAQRKLYGARVLVAIRHRVTRTIEEKWKRVSELTNGEAARVFDVGRVRDIKEQTALLTTLRRSNHILPSAQATDPVEEAEEHAIAGRLEENPKAELQRLLDLANNAMLEARSALAMVQRDSKHDALISTALRAIGELRYIAKNGELEDAA